MVIREVELLIVGVFDNVLNHRYSSLEEMLRISLFSVLANIVAADYRQVLGGYAFHEGSGCCIAAEPETQKLPATFIALKDGNMLV